MNLAQMITTAFGSLLRREAFLNWLMQTHPDQVQILLAEYEKYLQDKAQNQLNTPQNQNLLEP